MRRLVLDPALCTGCLSCVTHCSGKHEGHYHPLSSRRRVEIGPFTGANRHFYCRQCDSPSCAAACPEGAIERNEVTGAWVIDYGKCTGCLACVEACPFSAIFRDPVSGRVIKCDLCGGEPECALVCKLGALTFK